MAQALLALALVAYNSVLNRWPAFHGWAYVPANLCAGVALVAIALGPLGLDLEQAGLVFDGRDLVLGSGLGVLGAASLFALASWGRLHRVVADARAAGGRPIYRALIRIPIGTALFEEVAFRGVLLGVLLGGGRELALGASALVFGLWHVQPARLMARINRRPVIPTVIATVAFTSVAGFVFGVLRLARGNISMPVGLHAGFNALAYLAARRALGDHVASPR